MSDVMVIEGGRRLNGEIKISGAKNSVLPILAAAVINGGRSVIHNCPAIKDVDASFNILKELGCTVAQNGNDVVINSRNISCDMIKESLMREMRSSIIFTGAVLARCKKAVISRPGGCELGPRPIDLHLKAFAALGVVINEYDGYIACDAHAAKCADVYLDFPSVGATENIMLLSAAIPGKTTIFNAACEPEIIDLQNFLCGMGASISGAGTSCITIIGTDSFHDVEHSVIGDRIVAATYLCAAALTGGNVTVRGVTPHDLDAVLAVIMACGAEVDTAHDSITIDCPRRLSAAKTITTLPFPGFPTDAQAIMTSALSVARGTSVIEEIMFESRFKHTAELNRMGADISVKGRLAIIRGVERLRGASVTAYDLRGAASLVIAGLNADGVTEVSGLGHLYRGYEGLDAGLNSLGAKITGE